MDAEFLSSVFPMLREAGVTSLTYESDGLRWAVKRASLPTEQSGSHDHAPMRKPRPSGRGQARQILNTAPQVPPYCGGEAPADTAGVLHEAAINEPSDVATVHAPDFGILCLSHPLSPLPPALPGTQVSRGDVLAYVRVDDVLLPVLSTVDGEFIRYAATDGALIAYAGPIAELALQSGCQTTAISASGSLT